jgi:hypothetical protein
MHEKEVVTRLIEPRTVSVKPCDWTYKNTYNNVDLEEVMRKIHDENYNDVDETTSVYVKNELKVDVVAIYYNSTRKILTLAGHVVPLNGVKKEGYAYLGDWCTLLTMKGENVLKWVEDNLTERDVEDLRYNYLQSQYVNDLINDMILEQDPMLAKKLKEELHDTYWRVVEEYKKNAKI